MAWWLTTRLRVLRAAVTCLATLAVLAWAPAGGEIAVPLAG